MKNNEKLKLFAEEYKVTVGIFGVAVGLSLAGIIKVVIHTWVHVWGLYVLLFAIGTVIFAVFIGGELWSKFNPEE